MEREKQLRMLAWLMGFNAVVTALTCVLRWLDGEWLLGGLAAATALVSVVAVVQCRKGLRKLKNKQSAE